MLYWDDMLLLFTRFAKEQRLSVTASLDDRCEKVEREATKYAHLKGTSSHALHIATLQCQSHQLESIVPLRIVD